MTRQINSRGLDLIKYSEGLRLNAYPDPGTGGDPWTIGYGHTGPEVKKGMSITEAQAEALLRKDLDNTEAGITAAVNVPLNDNQFSALVSFAFNVGLGNLRSSTLLKLLNQGKYDEAAGEFNKWRKAAGKVLPGLVKRRQDETDLFLAK